MKPTNVRTVVRTAAVLAGVCAVLAGCADARSDARPIGPTISASPPPVGTADPAPTPAATSSSPPISTPLPAPTPDVERIGWNLVWHDEFDGDSLDDRYWTALDDSTYGDGNGELACLQASNVAVGDGRLTITARRLGNPVDCGSHDDRFPDGRSYSSGFVQTRQKLAFTYGRFEMRARLPTAPGRSEGLWPAFWLRPADGYGGEIDVMEALGTTAGTQDLADQVMQTIHYYDAGYGPGELNVYRSPTGRLDEDFHAYAVEWEPGSIRWYVDDALAYERTPATTPWLDEAFSEDFYLKINLAVGGVWPGDPDSDTSFPAEYAVDSVRVYQRP